MRSGVAAVGAAVAEVRPRRRLLVKVRKSELIDSHHGAELASSRRQALLAELKELLKQGVAPNVVARAALGYIASQAATPTLPRSSRGPTPTCPSRTLAPLLVASHRGTSPSRSCCSRGRRSARAGQRRHADRRRVPGGARRRRAAAARRWRAGVVAALYVACQNRHPRSSSCCSARGRRRSSRSRTARRRSSPRRRAPSSPPPPRRPRRARPRAAQRLLGAVHRVLQGHAEVAALLLQRAPVDQADERGNTPLFVQPARPRRPPPSSGRAPSGAAAHDGTTPLYMAAQNGNECVQLLEHQERGDLDVNRPKASGATPTSPARTARARRGAVAPPRRDGEQADGGGRLLFVASLQGSRLSACPPRRGSDQPTHDGTRRCRRVPVRRRPSPEAALGGGGAAVVDAGGELSRGAQRARDVEQALHAGLAHALEAAVAAAEAKVEACSSRRTRWRRNATTRRERADSMPTTTTTRSTRSRR